MKPHTWTLGLVVLACALLAPRWASADAEDGPSQNRLAMYLMLGSSAGRHDMNYGLQRNVGYGAGFGAMAGFAIPTFSVPGGDLGLGLFGGGDVLGGPEHTSADKDTGVWLNFRVEGGIQVNFPLRWQDLRVSMRGGGLILTDTAAGVVFGKSLKVRVDWQVYAAEVGVASGGADALSLTLRWRETFLRCFGLGIEYLSVPDRQSDGWLGRVFYAVDI